MLNNRIANLIKFDTEFGGAEPPTEPAGLTEPTETEEGFQDSPESEESKELAEGGAESPVPDLTEHMARRINKIREEAEEKVRQAEEKVKQATFQQPKVNESLEFLQVQGSINPYTGNVISNLAEYKTYKKMFEEESEQFNQAEPENILELVEEKVSEILTTREVEANAKNILKADLAKISRINPNIKTIADIEKLPESKTILEKVMRGYYLHDAYITSVQTKPVKPKEDTTGHMTSLKGGIGSATSIPANVLQDYKNFGYTEKQAIEDYEKMMKGK